VPTGFVGRADELAVLRAMCAPAAGDSAAVALVVGEPGSGKSRLLAEVVSTGDASDTIVLGGYEPEHQVPLACARGLFDRLRTLPGGDVLEGLAFGRSAATRQVDSIRLFEASHRALGALSRPLLAVDDLQWVDDTSLALLHYLVRAGADAEHGVRLIAASRPSPRAARFFGSCRHVLAAERVREIVLRPFAEEDGIRFVRAAAPGCDDGDARAVWAAAAGSPFWMELLAGSQHAAATLADEATARLTAGGADGETLGSLLAIVGRPLPIEAAVECLRWSPSRAEAAAEDLERAGVARREGDALSVVHDLIRQGILATVPEERARRLHRRFGDWLEATAGDDPQQLLTALEHLERGGAPLTHVAARLATSPRRRLLGTVGLDRLSMVLDADPALRAASDLGWSVASLAAELGAYDTAFRRWADCARTAADPVRAARAALEASSAATALAQPHDAWRYLEEARGRARLDDALAVEVRAQEAELLWYLEHRPAEAQEAVGDALAAARSLASAAGGQAMDDRLVRALMRSLQIALQIALTLDDPVAMLAFADELSALVAGADDRMTAHAEVNAALALRVLGRNPEAAARLGAAWQAVRQQVLPQATLEVGAMLANVLLSLGRLDEADAVSRECSVLGARLAEFGPSRALTIVIPHLLELARGDWRSAVEGLRAAASGEPDPHYRQQAHRERAAALARLDPRHAAADVRATVADTLADAELAGCARCLTEARAACAEALARIGDVEDAEHLLAETGAPAIDAYNRLCVVRAEAVLAAARTDPSAAAEFEAAAAAAEKQGLLLEALRLQLDLGEVLASSERGRAAEQLRRAAETAHRFGARTEQASAEQLLRALGVRTWRRGRSAQAGDDVLSRLSAREAEIARLISAGATNPEIAAATFVSRKTVERHVSNILAKLGLRNRAELAALIGDRLEEGTPAS
jgi:DNA-binding NarL/FixJ family response regulator